MSDLVDQYRILYHIYKANHNGEKIGISNLIADADLVFMHKVGNLIPSLNRLRKTSYVENNDEDLQLTGKGLITTEKIFRNFLIYIKINCYEELRTWINVLELHYNSSWELVRDAYFFVKNEPLMQRAFTDYLNELGNLENISTLEEKKVNMSGSIMINLTPEYARQINWGKPTQKPSQKNSQRQVDVPILSKIASISGITGVWYTDNKNSELFAVVKVNTPLEGKNIANIIKGYEGVKSVRISLGAAGPPPPSRKSNNDPSG